ncbi:MAG: peptidylprolyl isomerase [Pacificimonas sp.]
MKSTMFARMTGVALGALAALTSGATAQETRMANVPILSDLDPAQISQLIENSDPTVRKANAIVNGVVVTDTDIDQRLNLVLASNPNRVEDDERLRLKMQVMRNLIDEKLQIQASFENDIVISPQEIDNAYARVAQNFNLTPDRFADYLKERNTSERAIKQQIHAELAWSRLLRRTVEPFVNVGDDEVENLIARLEAAKGTDEYRIAEMVFFTTPETAPQVMQEANNIVGQLREGASFVAYARQYSQSSTATIGGDLGWVRLEQLPAELRPIVENLPQGQITSPVQVPGAIAVLALVDKRQVLTADEGDTILSLKQMTVPIDQSLDQSSAETFVAGLQTRVQSMGGCGGVEAVAAEYGGEVTTNDQLRLGDLPDQMQQIMGQMQTGQSTPPFGSMEDGIKVLTLCGREDRQIAAAPDFDNMYAQLEEQRVNMMARRYLRDLRRDAIIDYR